MCEKHNLERKEKWYEHCPEVVVEDDDVKLIWDINIQCDVMEARRPDLILVNKKAKSCVTMLQKSVLLGTACAKAIKRHNNNNNNNNCELPLQGC